MKKKILVIVSLFFLAFLISYKADSSLRVGQALRLSVYRHYICCDNLVDSSLDPISASDIFSVIQKIGLGISKSDLNNFLNNSFPSKLAGTVLLSVQENGEAYYIDPQTLEAHYLGRPEEALEILKELHSPWVEETINLELEDLDFLNNFSHIVSLKTKVKNNQEKLIKEQGILYDYSVVPEKKLRPSLDNYNQKVVSLDSGDYFVADVLNLIPGTYPFFRAYLITQDNHIFYSNTVSVKSQAGDSLPLIPSPSSSSGKKEGSNNDKTSKEEKETESGPPIFIVCGDDLHDERDGELYKTVKIGEQCWFQENLRYLPEVHDSLSDDKLFSTLYPYYGVAGYSGEDVAEAKKVKLGDLREQGLFTGDSSLSDSTNIYKTFGALYNWHAVMRDGPDSICPLGWHLATKDEWSELAEFYEPGGFINANYDGYAGYWSEAAGYLKSNFSSKWKALSGQPDLMVLPGGFRNSQGPYRKFGEEANFWTATNNGFKDIKTIHIGSLDDKLLNDVWWGESGLSVRCLKDD